MCFCTCRHPCLIKHFAKYSILYLSAVFKSKVWTGALGACPMPALLKNKPISGYSSNTFSNERNTQKLSAHFWEIFQCLSTQRIPKYGRPGLKISALVAPRQPVASCSILPHSTQWMQFPSKSSCLFRAVPLALLEVP